MILISNSKKDGKKMSLQLKSQFFYLDSQKYPDGEERLFMEGNTRTADVIYFKFNKKISFDEQLFDLICLLNGFSDKRKTDLVLPYLPYMRSYPLKANEVDKLIFIINQFNKRVRTIYLLYPHNFEKIKERLGFKNAILIDMDDLIIKYLKLLDKNSVLVSPDSGFSKNVERMAEKNGLDYIVLHKKRISPSEVIYEPINEENSRKILKNKNKFFVIIDDMVSTGNTLAGAALYLKKQGIKKIKYFVVHNTSKKHLKINVVSSNSLDGNIDGLDVLDSIVSAIKD